jgi:hypothetical protein
MELKNNEDFKLYTVEQVSEIFPKSDGRAKKGHVENVEALILAHGCYRRFGDAILLTQNDVHALLRSMSANSRVTDGAPAHSAEGYIVAIGSRTDPDVQMFVAWAPLHGLDNLIKDVSAYAEFKAELLDYKPARYGQFLGVREQLKPFRYFGHWYARSVEFQVVINELFASTQEREDDDEV